MDWFDLAVQRTLKSLLQYYSSNASILWCSAFFIVQLSHPCMTTGKTIALTRWVFVGKVMSLLFNMLSRLVIAFLFKEQVSFNFMSNSFAILWTVVPQAPLSMGICKQEYWSGFQFLLQGLFLTQGSILCLLQADSLPLNPQGSPSTR